MESSSKTRLPLHSIGTIYPSPSLRATLHLWKRNHSSTLVYSSLIYLWPKRERVIPRALMTPFLAIHAKGGESISPKQKDRTITLFKKKNFKKTNDFQLVNFKLVSYCAQKGEKVVFQKWYIKTLLNTKRRISFRGSFV